MKQYLLHHLKPLIFLWSSLGLFFAYIFKNAIIITPQGLFFGHEYLWSDWPLHIALANIFAYKNLGEWFLYHPLYAEGKLTYPFLSDFISGMLIRVGLPLTTSFFIPSIILIFTLITSLYFLFFYLFKSRLVPVLAIFIFVFSSGPGFLNFISDFLKNPNLNNLLFPPIEYSKVLSYDWGTGNVVVGLLLPQRAFLLGLTLGIIALLGLVISSNYDKKIKYRKTLLFGSGIVAGILPIAHPHSFIAVAIISGIFCLLNIKKIKVLAYYFIPATIVSVFLYLTFINGGIENKSFISFFPGWTSKGLIDFFFMWWKLWGIMIPIASASYLLTFRNKNRLLSSFFLGFFAIFLVSNLFLFQPTTWDNSKLFFWAYLGFSALASHLIVRQSSKNALWKIIMIFTILFLTLTGGLELTRLSRIDKHTYLGFSSEDIKMGIKIREETRPTDRFLTATTHNNLVMVWALRPIIMGYAGWVKNFGFNYQETESDIHIMYGGGKLTENLLKQYKVSYVFVGPAEKDNFNANLGYFEDNFPIIFQDSENRVFDVRKITSSF